jgi:hypothetical protein
MVEWTQFPCPAIFFGRRKTNGLAFAFAAVSRLPIDVTIAFEFVPTVCI